MRSAQRPLGHLIRADVKLRPDHQIRTSDAKVTVVDLHNLHDRAKRFVVGVTIRRTFDEKEASGSARPLLFLVLDELNKYAPAQGDSPIKEILLDVAERGRSLGIILIGAQQTASEVERRDHRELVDPGRGSARPRRGAARRVRVPVGRRTASGPRSRSRARCSSRNRRSRCRSWCSSRSRRGRRRPSERGGLAAGLDPSVTAALPDDPFDGFAPVEGRPAVKFLHTADWHVGKTIKGQSRLDEHRARARRHRRESPTTKRVDVVLVVGDLYETAAPSPEAEALVLRTLLDLRDTGARVVVLAGNHDNAHRFEAVRPVFGALGVTVIGRASTPADGGVVEIECRSGDSAARRARAVLFAAQRSSAPTSSWGSTPLSWRGPTTSGCGNSSRALTEPFADDAVNVVAAHCMVSGAQLGGGERAAQTYMDYWVGAAAFPAHAHYVALGHLHRTQQIGGAAPIWYSGSPLQVDFGERDEPSNVLVVEAPPGDACAEPSGGRVREPAARTLQGNARAARASSRARPVTTTCG